MSHIFYNYFSPIFSSNLLISQPHPISCIRLYRAFNNQDIYENFIEKTFQMHHSFWIKNNKKFTTDILKENFSYFDYIFKNSNEFNDYNKFVWKSNLKELWIYIKKIY